MNLVVVRTPSGIAVLPPFPEQVYVPAQMWDFVLGCKRRVVFSAPNGEPVTYVLVTEEAPISGCLLFRRSID